MNRKTKKSAVPKTKPAVRKAARKPVTGKKPVAKSKTTAKATATTKAKAGAKSKPAGKTKPGAKSKPRAAKPAASASRKPAAAAKRPARAGKPGRTAPRTLDDFMNQALVMEMEAAQRYADFADAMEMHNNLEVAALFRKMADIEGKHAQQIMAQMGWTTTPAPLPGAIHWDDFEAPETAPIDAVHYLMQPYHALEVALAAEKRAERFFAKLVRAATTPAVRKAAREMQEEEREHVELVRAWMKKVPKPDADWADDPDPPRFTD